MGIRIRRIALSMLLVGALAAGSPAVAQTLPPNIAPEPGEPTRNNPRLDYQYSVAQVVEVRDEEAKQIAEFTRQSQTIKAKITRGPEKGKEVTVTAGGILQSDELRRVKKGESVVIVRSATQTGEARYDLYDKLRLWPLAVLVGFFALLAAAVGRLRGVTSLLGLAFSISVFAWFIIPQIIAGRSPLLVTIVGVFIIATVSMYLAHGLKRRTSVALFSTLVTLTIAIGLATLAVAATKLFGSGSEQALQLQFGELQTVALPGLLLSGIIIGAMGVLDDITTTQTAAVGELRRANPKLGFRELYGRGLEVGREHIASLINTLALAYVGVSLPTLLILSTNNPQPLWITLNSELIAEEIVRTAVGSIALILAVSISTVVAAWFFSKQSPSGIPEDDAHHHAH